MVGVIASAATGQVEGAMHARLTPEAKRQMDTVVVESVREWQERQGCVAKWRMAGDTLVIEAIARDPEFAFADSMRTFVRGKVICADSLPMYHTHLPLNGTTFWTRIPSETDWGSLESRVKIPFGLLVGIQDRQTGEYMVGAYFSSAIVWK